MQIGKVGYITPKNTEEKEDFERIRELTKARILKRRQKRKKELFMHILLCSALVVILLTVVVVIMHHMLGQDTTGRGRNPITKYIENAPEYREDLLPVNPHSRPGTALERVNGIVVHYTGNPGTTAQQNHSYFKGLAESGQTQASSHFIVGLSGEIIMCVPLDEVAYASNDRNWDTISIECCIDNDAGKFNESTYKALVKLTAWLVGQYNLEIDDVIRHFDVTGKNCPKYFVEHESAWEDFKTDVVNYIEYHGVPKAQYND